MALRPCFSGIAVALIAAAANTPCPHDVVVIIPVLVQGLGMIQDNGDTSGNIQRHANSAAKVLAEVQNGLSFRAMEHFLYRQLHYRLHWLAKLGAKIR